METVTEVPPLDNTEPDPMDLGAQPQEPEYGPDYGDDGSLVIAGSGDQLSFGIGGKQPTSSSLTLTGGKLDIEGQFQKGEMVVLHVEVRIGEVGFKDEEDSKTGQVVGCSRRHRARIVGVERA